MRKLYYILIMFTICFNKAYCQIQYDTIKTIDEITLLSNKEVITNDYFYYDIVSIYNTNNKTDSAILIPKYSRIVFDIEGLDTNDYIVFNFNEYSLSHKLIRYDTINSIDTFYQVVPIFEQLFYNGHYDFYLTEMVDDTVIVDSIGVFALNDDNIDSVGTNQITIKNFSVIVESEVECYDICEEQVIIHPNPTEDIIYVDGEYSKLVIHDSKGRFIAKVIDSQVKSFDLSLLEKGQYFFIFNDKYTIKVIKSK